MIIKLSVKNLHFSYDSEDILNGISLNVTDGRVVSLLGPNGSGKSTFLKCIDRILEPQAGKVLVDRQDLLKMGRMDIAKTIAYVPQNSIRSFPNSVFDVVLMGRRPYLGWREDVSDEDEVWSVLRLLGIENLAMSSFTELSGGQQQKVLIARALVQNTGLILLDEPTSNLDLWHQIDVMEVIRSLVKKKRLTAIIAIHDLNMAAKYSDVVVMMKRGRIVAAGDPESVINSENIEKVYGVKANVKRSDDFLYIVPLERIPVKAGR
ncbi:iron complex transport system ATP-binding protein [Methanomicrobium sp. W14]|uniref:ABC transporter ATP-binding protein n=1 Tax=Methanomicrobium sp. W14 TaxID=2817839 RepID=UPI001AE8A016|nr:ABC transporter ATP-binding protein [Methanomicrobium sp. W14]MBP2134389.1 iron complex transport system ATP-binding protein [Methanomicrobium sp. W14]